MTVPLLRDPDLTQIVRNIRADLADLKATVIGRWGRIPHGTADPTSPDNGSIWVRDDGPRLRIRTGGSSTDVIPQTGSVTVAVAGTPSVGSNTVTFPVAFTASPIIHVSTANNSLTGVYGARISAFGQLGFTVNVAEVSGAAGTGNVLVYWVAYGTWSG